VTGRIRKIGGSPDIILETARKLEAELKSQIDSLENEGKYLRKELAMLTQQVKASSEGNGGDTSERVAERIRTCERRLSEVNRQKILLANTQVDEKELRQALGLFDPVWEVLYSQEQARICNMLIEKVIYDGEKGTITINFHPLGIRTLAEEAKAKDEVKA
jgi:hypothetical protein